MRILLIDDEEAEYILLKEMINGNASAPGNPEYQLDWVATYKEGRADIARTGHDLYLLDYRLGGRSGVDLLREPVAKECRAPIIMLTGMEDHAVDLAAMHQGAADYLVKWQVTLPLLERSIRYAMDRRQAEQHLLEVVEQRTRDLALLEQQAHEFSALQRATSTLFRTLEVPLLLGQIVDSAQDAIPVAEQVHLFLLEVPRKVGDALSDITSRDSRVSRLPANAADSPGMRQLRDGQTLLLDDTDDDAFNPFRSPVQPGRPKPCSALIAPLMLGKELAGALVLTSSWEAAFSESAQSVLGTFAATASAALQNAALHAELRGLAAVDALTGLLNRKTFFELGGGLVAQAARYGRPVSLIALDVDDFRELNGALGYEAGDTVLVEVARRAECALRPGLPFARSGSDELVAVLTDTDQTAARAIAAKIREAVSGSPIHTESGAVTVSLSVGIAQAGHGRVDLGTLLEQALSALDHEREHKRRVPAAGRS